MSEGKVGVKLVKNMKCFIVSQNKQMKSKIKPQFTTSEREVYRFNMFKSCETFKKKKKNLIMAHQKNIL